MTILLSTAVKQKKKEEEAAAQSVEKIKHKKMQKSVACSRPINSRISRF